MLEVSDSPTIADLNTLIVIKLTSYLDSPMRRAQDLADVVRLVEANGLGRSSLLMLRFGLSV
jgi:hypothetical protein